MMVKGMTSPGGSPGLGRRGRIAEVWLRPMILKMPLLEVTVSQGSVFLLTVNILYILVKSHNCCYLCWEIRRAEFLIQDGVEYQEAFIFRRCCVQESRGNNMAAGRSQDERTIPRQAHRPKGFAINT